MWIKAARLHFKQSTNLATFGGIKDIWLKALWSLPPWLRRASEARTSAGESLSRDLEKPLSDPRNYESIRAEDLEEHSKFTSLLSYFSIAVIKSRKLIQRKHLIWGLWFQRMRVHDNGENQFNSICEPFPIVNRLPGATGTLTTCISESRAVQEKYSEGGSKKQRTGCLGTMFKCFLEDVDIMRVPKMTMLGIKWMVNLP